MFFFVLTSLVFYVRANRMTLHPQTRRSPTESWILKKQKDKKKIKKPKPSHTHFILFLTVSLITNTVTSLVSGHPRNWKKCPLVELSAYENYFHKKRRGKSKKEEIKTVSVIRAVRLRECPLAES